MYSGEAMLDLTTAGKELLKIGIHGAVAEFAKATKKDPHGTYALKLFLCQPHVQQSEVWLQLFGALPPRGTLARMARRLDMELDESVGFYVYESKAQFLEEVNRMEAWYKTIKKNTR